MFIKLTRFDNMPIWVNASFVVTVEPRREGNGAVVVPIGDGLDYDVRESPEAVLAMLEGAPAAAVVPIPVSDCLTKTPVDVSPEPEVDGAKNPAESEKPAAELKPRKRATKAKTKSVAKKTAEPVDESVVPVVTDLPQATSLTDEQVARLRKMAPKTVSKLKNTLLTQFKVCDVETIVQSLEATGAMKLEGSRVLWPTGPEMADW